MKRRMPKRLKPQKPGDDYRRLWRLVDGAIRDAFAKHPEYVPQGRRETEIRSSLAKRIVGAVKGHAEQSARSRSGGPAADNGTAACSAPFQRGEAIHPAAAGRNSGTAGPGTPPEPASIEVGA